MAPTSDERRRVAERLRYQAKYARRYDGREDDLTRRRSIYNDIAGSIRDFGQYELAGSWVLDALADLIEPEGDEDAD